MLDPSRWGAEQPAFTPRDIQAFITETTIHRVGQDDGRWWAQLTAPDGGEYWLAVDSATHRAAWLPYAEGLETITAYESRLDRPLVCWQFDVVSQRPPAVRPVARRPVPDGDGLPLPEALPGPLAVVFDRLEIDVVTAQG